MIAKWLSKLALKTVADSPCPKCGEVYGDNSKMDVRDGKLYLVCGSCGAEMSHEEFQELVKSAREEALNPREPLGQPEGSRVKVMHLADGSVGLDIPRSGKAGGLLFFGILWLALSIGVGVLAGLGGNESGAPGWAVLGFLSLFALVGLVIVYAALGMRNKTHHLLVGNGQLRYASRFLGREKRRVYPAADVRSVGQIVFYSQNYVPVYGVEIEIEGGRSIRFGTQLMEEEKRWLVWEIRNALRTHGNERVLPQ